MGSLVPENFLGSAERKKENKEEKEGKRKEGEKKRGEKKRGEKKREERKGKRKETAADVTFIFLLRHCLCVSVNCFNCMKINIILIYCCGSLED